MLLLVFPLLTRFKKFMGSKTDRYRGRLAAVGHIYADVVVKGSRGEISLRNVIVDAGASYTVLWCENLRRFGVKGRSY